MFDWYPLIRAARYLGVPPWDLAGVPDTRSAYCWQIWALAAEGAESLIQEAYRNMAG